MIFRMPVLRIHAWGGLGSQLFAVSLAQRIRFKFPKRRIVIVLHSGGVTRRVPEVISLFREFNFEFLDDYSPLRSMSIEKNPRMKALLRGLLGGFFEKSGLIIAANSELEFSRLRAWTFATRGHYSEIEILPGFLSLLDERLTSFSHSGDLVKPDSISVHFRLGDLISLGSKEPTKSIKVTNELLRVMEIDPFTEIILHSDSPVEAKAQLQSFFELEILTPELDTLALISECVSKFYFVGTSSKVSYWITAIRAVVHELPSSLPFENALKFSNMWKTARGCVRSY